MFWVMSQAARAAAWSQVSEQRQLRWRTQRRCNEASGQWPGGPFNFGAAAGAVSRRNGERHLPLGLHATEISHGQGANYIGTGEGASLERAPLSFAISRSQARVPGSSHGCCISMFSLSPVALLVSIESPCACLPTQRNATQRVCTPGCAPQSQKPPLHFAGAAIISENHLMRASCASRRYEG